MFGMFCGISKIVLIYSVISGGILEPFGSLVGKHWSIPSQRSLCLSTQLPSTTPLSTQLCFHPVISIYLLNYSYLLTPWSRVLLEKLTGFQLVKKFLAFYGTRRFITAFTSATCPYPEPARSGPYFTSHFLKIHPNISLPSMPGSSQWFLSLRFSHQNPVILICGWKKARSML
jgi:hypothetical protein